MHDPAPPSGFLRKPHGRAKTHGAPGPRVQVHPPGELSQPLPDPRPAPEHVGKFTRENAAQYGARGGALAKGRPSLAGSLGISADLTPSAQEFDPYRRRAATFRKAHVAELARLAGGECGTGPSSMVATAALQLAASRYLYDLATRAIAIEPLDEPEDDAEEDQPKRRGRPRKAPRQPSQVDLLREARYQGDSARQNLLAAFELAIREGRARGTAQPGRYDPDEVTRRAEAEAAEKRARRKLPQTIDTTAEPQA